MSKRPSSTIGPTNSIPYQAAGQMELRPASTEIDTTAIVAKILRAETPLLELPQCERITSGTTTRNA